MNIKNSINKKNIVILLLLILICGIIFFFQTQKSGFHEDEIYSQVSAVNPYNGLMSAYENDDVFANQPPVWKSREYVKDYVTLTTDNYLNMVSIYKNQAIDNHPPVFYVLAHFSSILFGGNFTKYSIFLVNIIAFLLSCIVIKKIFKTMNKENLTIPTIILYGLSMGTISMVLYQRMYMVLTLFILLYFYYSIKIYINEFNIDKKLMIKLGLVTVFGFLTQYFFVFYAAVIFLIIAIAMIKNKKYKNLAKYVIMHVIYAAIGIILFPPCIYHLLMTDRGIKNLENTNYLTNLVKYIEHIAYSFSIKEIMLVLFPLLLIVFIGITYLKKKTNERFFVYLAAIPTTIFLLLTVQLTSFQKLRYIMPIIPFIVIIFYLMLDILIDVKYKNYIFIGISVILVLNGLIFATPKFLYKNYNESIKIAENNKEKSFVYVYDNFFNHMQSIPEMMIYEKTLIINTNKNELEYLSKDEELNNENEYILCIKNYMNNEEILNYIKNNTDFKNIEKLYTNESFASDEYVLNNLYLVSK